MDGWMEGGIKGGREGGTELSVNSLAMVMCLVILLNVLVLLLKARQEYGPLWSSVTPYSSSSALVPFTASPLKAHWSWAGGLDWAEQKNVRLDPVMKEVVFCPFTVKSMPSGPSESGREQETEKRGETDNNLDNVTNTLTWAVIWSDWFVSSLSNYMCLIKESLNMLTQGDTTELLLVMLVHGQNLQPYRNSQKIRGVQTCAM